ncbi:SRPBCC domain-containing protein [Hydrogenophaga sp. 5NK40-0174]|uniref:SRPBCC domain-containing protein n=1 Tax=Hydrogenophaga sp. 5NK40-0174 TaxID=3127649 RepID=UPI003103AF7F
MDDQTPDEAAHFISTSRTLSASPEQIWSALTTPERLARWWGPEGFSNDVETCDLREGGQWVFDMIGPDGKRYANRSEFEVLEAPHRWVVRHVCAPLYRLTITLTPDDNGGTRLQWDQRFDNPRTAEGLGPIVGSANEQNIDRLWAELQRP